MREAAHLSETSEHNPTWHSNPEDYNLGDNKEKILANHNIL